MSRRSMEEHVALFADKMDRHSLRLAMQFLDKELAESCLVTVDCFAHGLPEHGQEFLRQVESKMAAIRLAAHYHGGPFDE